MRPLKLTLRSFGPFAGQQVVDFTRFGIQSFLLIHGPTGAGKTTILDGICYALYGDPSGEKRSEHYLRCQQAAVDSLCEVEFIFQVGPARYHIRRIPPQSATVKGKRRELKHQVELCRIDEQGVLIGERLSKVSEVTARIEQVIGFTSAQFRQVVVLPQGEFRRLLLARSDEKEQILEKLFGTGRYKLMEELLKRRRATLNGQLRELQGSVAGLLAGQGYTTLEELQRGVEQVRQQFQELERELAQQLQLQQDIRHRLTEAEALAARFQELEQARCEQARLGECAPAMELLAGQLEQARRCFNLDDLDQAVARLDQDLNGRRQELAALELGMTQLATQLEQAREAAAAARKDQARLPELAAERVRLESVVASLASLEACRRRLQTGRQHETTAFENLELLRSDITAAGRQQEQLNREIEALSLTSAAAGQLSGERERLQGLIVTRASYDADQAELSQLTERIAAGTLECSRRQAALDQARQLYDTLQGRFIQGQAALLAGELKQGCPCPVCGSAEHPHPAPRQGDIPGEQELEQARLAQDNATSRLQKADRLMQELTLRRSVLEAGLEKLALGLPDGLAAPMTELQRRVEDLAAKQAAAVSAAERLAQLRSQRDSLSTALEQARQKLAPAENLLVQARAEREACQLMAQNLERETGGREPASLQARLVEIEGFTSRAAQALQAAESGLMSLEGQCASAQGQQGEKQALIERLEQELMEQRQRFYLRLAQEGFPEEQTYRAARLPREQVVRQQEELEVYRQQVTAAGDRLQRAEAACCGLQPPDLGLLRGELLESDQLLGQLQTRSGQLTGLQRALDETLAAIARSLEAIEQLEQEYAVTGGVADLAGGNNPLRMTLQRFVLASLFEEVALAASQRLSRMSRGRYHLVRSEAPRDGKATGGLDLDVIDSHIGERRPTFTLSGGESFLASLALALGLSDVVMAQSGGRYLDCIFIDEGFGSLDGETLDFALNTLIELHRGGRMIGIISHVPELKERIPSRIEVRAGRDGSHVLVQPALGEGAV